MGFSVTKLAQSFVGPSEPTPSETLGLSVIDRFPGSRRMVPSLHVFKHGQQPAMVTKDALSKALVPYYPLAGRFVVSEQGDDMVKCSGEGALFVEAAADCTLEDVKHLHHVPLMIPESDLLPQPPSGTEPLDVPIMMQVTEFKCGGFVVGFTFNHAIADGMGAAQFMNAVGDFARGNTVPAVVPIWSRHLVPNPPKLPPGSPPGPFPSFNIPFHSFDLPDDFIARIKSEHLDIAGHGCTTFEIFAATLWKIRTRAINYIDPETPVHLCVIANVRHLLTPQILPPGGGYYGNCAYPVVVTASSGSVANAEATDIVKMIQDGKARLPGEFARWREGGLGEDPWALPATYDTFIVSDWSNLGFLGVDCGWGKPVRVIPFADGDFNVVYVRPLVMVHCVKEEHLSAFQEHKNRLL